jgi:hypothetical protein
MKPIKPTEMASNMKTTTNDLIRTQPNPQPQVIVQNQPTPQPEMPMSPGGKETAFVNPLSAFDKNEEDALTYLAIRGA